MSEVEALAAALRAVPGYDGGRPTEWEAERQSDALLAALSAAGLSIVSTEELAGLRRAAEALRTVKVHPETIEACLRELGNPGDRREAIVWSAAQGYVTARAALEGAKP